MHPFGSRAAAVKLLPRQRIQAGAASQQAALLTREWRQPLAPDNVTYGDAARDKAILSMFAIL